MGSAVAAPAQQVPLDGRPMLSVAPTLRSGEYVWAPESSAEGPALAVVNLETQRLILFRNGVPIGASTVSSGKTGHETPTGVFTILQKRQEHYSKTYNNAPMPNMQRLTWKGIALHAGNLPGYPASHGCIRLPMKFSSLLFGATSLGMTVVITSLPVTPRASDAPELATASVPGPAQTLINAAYEWTPEMAKGDGIASVVVSTADQRAIVLRDGVIIGSAPVRVKGDLQGGFAYVLRSWDQTGQHWLKLQFSGPGGSMEVEKREGERFETPAKFRYDVATVLRPGSVVVVTPQSLKAGDAGKAQTVIEND
jgi:hypothetical protein